MVYLTGVLELLGALGLAIARTRRRLRRRTAVRHPARGEHLRRHSRHPVRRREPASPLWQRMPEQILYIAAALWATRGALPLPGLRHPAGAPRAERA